MKTYFTYMMTNKNKTVIYIGMTNNIFRRVMEHKNHDNPTTFTARYNVDNLVWIELFYTAGEAIAREKQLKNWMRKWKIKLIRKDNPDLIDLANGWT